MTLVGANPRQHSRQKGGERAHLAETVIDQAISGASNFVTLVLIARLFGLAEFGAFSVAFSVYLLYVGLVRATSGELLVIRTASGEQGAARAGVKSSQRFAVACTLVGVAAAFVAPSSMQTVAIVLLLAPGLVMQDILRYVAFAAGRPRVAIASDTCWLVSMAATLVLLTSRGAKLSLTDCTILWALTGWAAAVWPLILMRPFLALRSNELCVATNSRQRWRAATLSHLGEYATRQATTQLAILAIGTVSGLTALGTFRLADATLGPLRTVTAGLAIGLLPWTAQRARNDTGRALIRYRALAAMIVLLGVVTVSVLVTLPPAITRNAIGGGWTTAKTLVIPLGVFTCAVGIAAVASTGLKGLGLAREAVRARAITGGLLLIGLPLGAAHGGAPGAARAAAVVGILTAGVWWWRWETLLND